MVPIHGAPSQQQHLTNTHYPMLTISHSYRSHTLPLSLSLTHFHSSSHSISRTMRAQFLAYLSSSRSSLASFQLPSSTSTLTRADTRAIATTRPDVGERGHAAAHHEGSVVNPVTEFSFEGIVQGLHQDFDAGVRVGRWRRRVRVLGLGGRFSG